MTCFLAVRLNRYYDRMNLPVVKKETLGSSSITTHEDRYGIPDQMQRGTDGFAKTQLAKSTTHPLQAVEEARPIEAVRQELALAKHMFGSQLSQQLFMEMKACSQIRRFPGPIPSSHCMLNTLTGADEMVYLEDILQSPDFQEHEVALTPLTILK